MKTFTQFFNGLNSVEEYPIYSMSADDLVIFGATSPIVWLSRVSVTEHKEKHPEIGAEHYYKIADMVKFGEIYQQNNKRFVLLYQDSALYRAAIKITQDNKKMYLLTLFKTTEEKATKEVRKKMKLVKKAP